MNEKWEGKNNSPELKLEYDICIWNRTLSDFLLKLTHLYAWWKKNFYWPNTGVSTACGLHEDSTHDGIKKLVNATFDWNFRWIASSVTNPHSVQCIYRTGDSFVTIISTTRLTNVIETIVLAFTHTIFFRMHHRFHSGSSFVSKIRNSCSCQILESIDSVLFTSIMHLVFDIGYSTFKQISSLCGISLEKTCMQHCCLLSNPILDNRWTEREKKKYCFPVFVSNLIKTNSKNPGNESP